MNDSQTIAIALSGGVDSCVSAALLVDEGWSVIGVTAILTQERSRCCAEEDIEIARQVCEGLGIEHHLVDVHELFEEKIIGPFMSEYLSGRTPSPCALCNPLIKFGALMDRAAELGATHLATGHYARKEFDTSGQPHLFRGVDPRKDQSYFLALLTPDQLTRTVFPVGSLEKRHVAQLAAEKGLAARKSRESQEVCFVPEGDHGTWMDLRCLDTVGGGDILDTTGRKLGTHRGVHHYTIGQRRGVGVATGAPVYVTAIDAETNQLIVGPRDEAMRDHMVVRDLNWIQAPSAVMDSAVLAQIRYNHAPASCRSHLRDDGSLSVVFDEPQFAITPGQLAVLYRDNEVLGGGWIE